jgi:hypothetical protein
VLTLALALATAATACEFKEGKQPPSFEVERFEGAHLKFSADPKWFQCTKRAGGTLQLTFSVSDGETTTELKPKKLTSYSENEGIYRREICASGPGIKKVQAKLKGEGGMEPLNFTSEPGEVYCERCEFASGDNMFVLHTSEGHLTPRGMLTIEGTLDKRWFECAREGSTLELWLYAADTRLEAQEGKEPTHKVQGLEAQHYKKAFSKARICKEKPKFLGYELHGTGEFERLNGMGRGVTELRCRD